MNPNNIDKSEPFELNETDNLDKTDNLDETDNLDQLEKPNNLNESNIYFINVECSNMTAKKHVYTKFDYEISEDMYDKMTDDDYPLVYNSIYSKILEIQKDKKIITFSPDPVISCATIASMSEKYMYGELNSSNVKSSLKIIYLTAKSHMLPDNGESSIENFTNTIITNLLGLNDSTYFRHKLLLQPEQFYILGINDNLLENNEKQILDNSNIIYFTLNHLRKKGIKNIINLINDKIIDDPVFIVYDMSVTSFDTAPCVSRFLNANMKPQMSDLNGLNVDELKIIFNSINKENLVGLDVIGYDYRFNTTDISYRISCETAKLPLYMFGIKDKKINIFNDHSKFIIFRPITQIDCSDLFWNILKNVSLELREQLITLIGDDNIITLDIDDETYLVSTTTVSYQEQKSVYSSDVKIIDCVLCSNDKISMVFELLNTDENIIT
jgi:hypothetical protein